MPDFDVNYNVVRVNDGNDSNVNRKHVLEQTSIYPMKFYNTAIPNDLEGFNDPVVLTINPATLTDTGFHRLKEIPSNLMFVRFRVNMWNLRNFRDAVHYYGDREVPIVATFMAYFKESIPDGYKSHYTFRKRTINSYWAINTESWRTVMRYWNDTKWEKWVYSCGKIEGEKGVTACRHCGNCLREYFAAMERIKLNP